MKAARRQRAPAPVGIPKFVIDFFLRELGKSAPVERFTQDGGIVSDLWYAFGSEPASAVRILLSPTEGVSPVEVGAVLYKGIRDYREQLTPKDSKGIGSRQPYSVSPLENFVAARIYLDELLRIALPLTRWWCASRLHLLHPDNPDSQHFQRVLSDEIRLLGGRDKQTTADHPRSIRTEAGMEDRARHERAVRSAAPVAALVGLFALSLSRARTLRTLPVEPTIFYRWLAQHIAEIADAAVAELTRPIMPMLLHPALSMTAAEAARTEAGDRAPPALIHRVFGNRDVSTAVALGISTVKADAANRLFDISCSDISWGIIDSGIDPTHPAFDRHDGKRDGESRIKAILDFTLMEAIRNFALTEEDNGAYIRTTITQLKDLPDYTFLPEAAFDALATRNLDLIAAQMRQSLQPDWRLIEPLIRRRGAADGEADPPHKVISSHGTHVAGILGADWRSQGNVSADKAILRGICPDINLYDLRVLHPDNEDCTESAVLAALEYVQFANRTTLGMKQVIHGVNISLSIPHQVRTYACGATPVCVACNNLVGAGVVVVAAAGNRGWDEREANFGNFVFSSITDPGNAEDVITVGATHRERPHTYGVSYFSSRGPTGDGRIKPDLVAPGEKINGPVPNQSSDEFDGTSMAAPFVSGAAAMLIARNVELTGNPRRIKQILRDSATDLGREKYFQGEGLVDVLRALQSV